MESYNMPIVESLTDNLSKINPFYFDGNPYAYPDMPAPDAELLTTGFDLYVAFYSRLPPNTTHFVFQQSHDIGKMNSSSDLEFSPANPASLQGQCSCNLDPPSPFNSWRIEDLPSLYIVHERIEISE
jgi:hypothetical protein